MTTSKTLSCVVVEIPEFLRASFRCRVSSRRAAWVLLTASTRASSLNSSTADWSAASFKVEFAELYWALAFFP